MPGARLVFAGSFPYIRQLTDVLPRNLHETFAARGLDRRGAAWGGLPGAQAAVRAGVGQLVPTAEEEDRCAEPAW
jgi:hypothetical protein